MLEGGNIEAEAKGRLVRNSLGRAKSQPKGIGMCKGPEPGKNFCKFQEKAEELKGEEREDKMGKKLGFRQE